MFVKLPSIKYNDNLFSHSLFHAYGLRDEAISVCLPYTREGL
jgi:hypothetical protein